MKNNEFYTPKEFNKTSEFMRFSPELYLTPPQNKPQVEVPFTGQEHSTDKNHQSQNGQGGAINKNKPKKSNATGKDSSLQKIMDFATKAGTTVVTTATAAAISVTSLTGLFTPKPTIDLLSLTAGQNSVSYEFVIDDMDSNIDYSVKIENAYHSFEIPIESNEVTDTVDGLREFNSYGFNIVGEAGDGSGEIVYFSTNFYTLNNQPATALNLSDPMLVGLNTYYIPYSVENALVNSFVQETVELVATCNDGTVINAYTSMYKGKHVFILENVPQTATSITYEGTLVGANEQTGEEQTIKTPSKTFELTETINLLDAVLCLDAIYSGTVEMSFGWRGEEGSKVQITDENGEKFFAYDGETLSFTSTSSNDVQTFTYDVVDANDTLLFNGDSVTIDYTVTGEFVMDYSNPLSVMNTFNQDGTVNLYVPVTYSTTDEDIYFEFTYYAEFEVYYVQIDEPITVLELLDNPFYESGYYISYYVYKQVGNVKYRLFYVNPSGSTTLLSWIDLSSTVNFTPSGVDEGGTLDITISTDSYAYRDDFVTVSIDDVEEIIKFEDMTYDDSLRVYTYAKPCNISPSTVKIVSYAYNTNLSWQLLENMQFKGDRFAKMEKTFNL